LQTKLDCFKLTKATLRASLSSSLLLKFDGGNAPLGVNTYDFMYDTGYSLPPKDYINKFGILFFIEMSNKMGCNRV
jgi:hypothetical protein